MSKSRFESFVNSERCKTKVIRTSLSFCLRALLIQKDVKLLTVSTTKQKV